MGKNEIILKKESRETELILQSVNIPCKASIFNTVYHSCKKSQTHGKFWNGWVYIQVTKVKLWFSIKLQWDLWKPENSPNDTCSFMSPSDGDMKLTTVLGLLVYFLLAELLEWSPSKARTKSVSEGGIKKKKKIQQAAHQTSPSSVAPPPGSLLLWDHVTNSGQWASRGNDMLFPVPENSTLQLLSCHGNQGKQLFKIVSLQIRVPPPTSLLHGGRVPHQPLLDMQCD